MSRGFTHESPVNESFEWYTPPFIFDALGVDFDLDPCSPGANKSHVPAKQHFTIADDGLAQPWHGTVFVNPPYGPQTKVWMEKFKDHNDGVALVFSRTDVQWFHSVVTDSTCCFVAKRIRFIKGDTGEPGGSPGAGSVLIGLGEKGRKAVKNCGLGVVMEPCR